MQEQACCCRHCCGCGSFPIKVFFTIIAPMFTRYEKQRQEEEVSLQQQRRRLYKELADEKERLAQLASR